MRVPLVPGMEVHVSVSSRQRSQQHHSRKGLLEGALDVPQQQQQLHHQLKGVQSAGAVAEQPEGD